MRGSTRYVTLFLLAFLMICSPSMAQVKKSGAKNPWKTISKDEMVTISYNTNITTKKNGEHVVWVKAVYHTSDWQMHFARLLGIRTPVVTTKTKALFDERYSYVMVRQVICYNKAGKQIYDTGEDGSADWYPVNASAPVGIVGEYLEAEARKKMLEKMR